MRESGPGGYGCRNRGNQASRGNCSDGSSPDRIRWLRGDHSCTPAPIRYRLLRMPIHNFVMATLDGNNGLAMAKPNPQARIWLFDFDNPIAHLESEVDWAAGRRELEAFLRTYGVAAPIFAEIPKGNLPLYEALRGGLAGLAVGQQTLLAKDGAAKAGWGTNGELLLREASAIIERYELAGIDRAEPTPGAIELLEALTTRSRTIAIVTSNSSRTIAHWLERHRTSELIRTIVGRDTLLALKP